MLLGLYDVGAGVGSNTGGIFGHWVGERCTGSGVVALVYFLLWLAFPTGLLIATDWLFFRYLFGQQKPLLAASGASSVLAEGKKIVSSLGSLKLGSLSFRSKPRWKNWKKKSIDSELVADTKTMSQATVIETEKESETDYADPAVRPMGSSPAREISCPETWRTGWEAEKADGTADDAAAGDDDSGSHTDETVIRLTAVAEPEAADLSDDAIGTEAAEALEGADWTGGLFGPPLETVNEELPPAPASVSDSETMETDQESRDESTWWKSNSLSNETAEITETEPDESPADRSAVDAAGDETEAITDTPDLVSSPIAEEGAPEGAEEVEAESGEAFEVMLDKSWWTPPAEPLAESAETAESAEIADEEIVDLSGEIEESEEPEELEEPEEIDESRGPEEPDELEDPSLDDEEPAGDPVDTVEAPVEEQTLQPETAELDIAIDDEEVEGDEMDRISSEVEESVIEGVVESAETTVDTAVDTALEPEPQAEFSFEAPHQESRGPAVNEEEERLFKNAVSVVVREKKGSISLLQKELGLGYFRAAKLLNILESRNVIAPYAGSIARKVVISDEEAERIVSEESP